MKSLNLLILICALSLLFSSQNSFATLGEQESSVQSEKSLVKAHHIKLQTQNFTTHELTIDGNTVKEFVSSNGIVFAVSWSGQNHPDLSQLFGSYYEEFALADTNLSKPHSKNHPPHVQTSKIAVHRWGHMNDIHGLAYIPKLLPAGVDLASLK